MGDQHQTCPRAVMESFWTTLKPDICSTCIVSAQSVEPHPTIEWLYSTQRLNPALATERLTALNLSATNQSSRLKQVSEKQAKTTSPRDHGVAPTAVGCLTAPAKRAPAAPPLLVCHAWIYSMTRILATRKPAERKSGRSHPTTTQTAQ